MADAWSPSRYLKFEDYRTRPAIDLLARIMADKPTRVTDLCCGPGNSTEPLLDRFPGAIVSGIDSSPKMITAARERLPSCNSEVADLSTWKPDAFHDVLFANAALQWLPDHNTLLPRLMSYLNVGGSLAIQMPDNLDEPTHVSMRAAADRGKWAEKLNSASGERTTILAERNAWKVQSGEELAFSAMEQRLSRSGVKETTLDYTRDFAERRGIAEHFGVRSEIDLAPAQKLGQEFTSRPAHPERDDQDRPAMRASQEERTPLQADPDRVTPATLDRTIFPDPHGSPRAAKSPRSQVFHPFGCARSYSRPSVVSVGNANKGDTAMSDLVTSSASPKPAFWATRRSFAVTRNEILQSKRR
jgi:trans-aconitate methyltransferase